MLSNKDKILLDKLPQHIAIIMDGNGRWAQKINQLRTVGHEHGVKAVRDTTEAAAELGIKHLTLYAFSTENWSRPQFEVDSLMQLLVTTIHGELKTLNENNIRLNTIGDINSLPADCRSELRSAIEHTKNNSRMTLHLALSYSSKWELMNAIRNIYTDFKNNNTDIDSLSYEDFSNYLSTAGIPDPDLLIRTGGDLRLSNFLLLQLAYAELYFTPTLWPDFDKEEFYKAIIEFQSRERRFGKTSEQLFGI